MAKKKKKIKNRHKPTKRGSQSIKKKKKTKLIKRKKTKVKKKKNKFKNLKKLNRSKKIKKSKKNQLYKKKTVIFKKKKNKKILNKQLPSQPNLFEKLKETINEYFRKTKIKLIIYIEKIKIKKIKKEIVSLEKLIKQEKRFQEKKAKNREKFKTQLLKDIKRGKQSYIERLEVKINEFLRRFKIKLIIFLEKFKIKKTKKEILRLEKLIQQEQRFQEKKIRDRDQFRLKLLKDIKREERQKIFKLRDHLWKIGDRFSLIRDKYKAYRAKIREKQLEELEIRKQSRAEARVILEAEKAENALKQKLVERLERFSRNMKSIVFQINKRYITKKRAQLRFIDNITESGECLIRNDDAPSDKDYLILLYVEGDNVEKRLENPISLDDKTNPAETKNFQPKDIFEASDYIIDRLALMFDKERKIKK